MNGLDDGCELLDWFEVFVEYLFVMFGRNFDVFGYVETVCVLKLKGSLVVAH